MRSHRLCGQTVFREYLEGCCNIARWGGKGLVVWGGGSVSGDGLGMAGRGTGAVCPVMKQLHLNNVNIRNSPRNYSSRAGPIPQ